MKKLIYSALVLLSAQSSYAQKCDTTYYWTQSIQYVNCKNEGEQNITAFYNLDGENILTSNSITYGYYDQEYRMDRVIKIIDYEIFEDFWWTKTDTIYNQCRHNNDFQNQTYRFIRYLRKNLKYPKEARKKSIEKEINLGFIVNKSGQIENIKAITKIGYGLEENAMKVIEKYDQWGVIKYQGKPINMYLIMPINFELL